MLEDFPAEVPVARARKQAAPLEGFLSEDEPPASPGLSPPEPFHKPAVARSARPPRITLVSLALLLIAIGAGATTGWWLGQSFDVSAAPGTAADRQSVGVPASSGSAPAEIKPFVDTAKLPESPGTSTGSPERYAG